MIKRLLMFAAGLAMTASAACADDDSLVFGYCREYVAGIGNPGTIRAAIEIPAETARLWTGNKLTKVRIGFGQTNRNDITVYLTEALNKNSFYDQEATITKMDGWNEITLDTPYEIDGSGFFIGYEYAKCTQGEYPVGVDDVQTESTLGDNVYASSMGWSHIGSIFGSVCIQAVIEGDNLPQNDVAIVGFKSKSTIKPSSAFTAMLTVTNQGAKTVKDLGVDVYLDGEKLDGYSVRLSPSELAPGATGTVTLAGLYTEQTGIDLGLTVEISSVNSAPDDNPENNSVTEYLSSFTDGFKKNIVVEEWTGTWCGYCPRGIVGMGYMKEKYGDDGFIGIAVHGNNGTARDPMTISSYLPFLNTWAIVGYPGCVMNRSTTFDPNIQELEKNYISASKESTFVRVAQLSAEYNDGNPGELNVSAAPEFLYPLKEGGYRLAFVITENNFGPYYQTNYFTGAKYDMGGWENYPGTKMWYYDEVARDITDWDGIAGSIPEQLDAMTPAPYSTTISLANVKYLRRCDLIALVINERNGEIVNAAKMSLRETGVEGVEAEESVAVTTRPGAIEIRGEYAEAEVFAIDGTRVAAPDSGGTITLGSGIYVVRVTGLDGKTTIKKVRV